MSLFRRLLAGFLCLTLAFPPSLAAAAAALVPVGRSTPLPGGLVPMPRFPAAEPGWSSALAKHVNLSPQGYDALAYALKASGLSLEELRAPSSPGIEARVEGIRLALTGELAPHAERTLASARGLKPQELESRMLLASHAELRYLADSLSPLLPNGLQGALQGVYGPFQDTALERKLVDQAGNILETTRALLSGVGTLEAILEVAGKESPPRNLLAKPSPTGASTPLAARKRPLPSPASLASEKSSRGPAAQGFAPERSSSAPAQPSLWRRLAKPLRLAAFAGLLLGLFQGRPPALASDMDETLTRSQAMIDRPMARAIAGILKAGGRFGLLTGASLKDAQDQLIEPLKAALGPKDKHRLGRLYLGVRSGSQIYRYDPAADRFVLVRAVNISDILAAAGRPGGLETARRIIEETAEKFRFEEEAKSVFGTGVRGRIAVEDWTEFGGLRVLTQISVVPAGNDIRKDPKAKQAYDQANGREKRERYAAYIRRRFQEEGLPLEVRVGGLTSIDIGINKGDGFQALAQAMGTEPAGLLWCGDSHEEGGNDRPAAVKAGAVIHVGPRLSLGLGRRTFSEDSAGPGGLLAYFRLVEVYARAVSLLRPGVRAPNRPGF